VVCRISSINSITWGETTPKSRVSYNPSENHVFSTMLKIQKPRIHPIRPGMIEANKLQKQASVACGWLVVCQGWKVGVSPTNRRKFQE